jgi:hypothetical protein
MSSMETPDDSKPPTNKELATAIRRLFFAIGILAGLVFSVICYGEMIGLFEFFQAPSSKIVWPNRNGAFGGFDCCLHPFYGADREPSKRLACEAAAAKVAPHDD